MANTEKNKKQQNKNRHPDILPARRGFTLFIAVLISSLLLAVGLAIFNITLKELILSSTIRDSQFAFYAADGGTECALYWDRQQNAFSTSSPENQIVCSGASIPITIVGFVRTFTLDTLQNDNRCSVITVTKTYAGSTTIESRGYNTCDPGNSRRVERGIRVRY